MSFMSFLCRYVLLVVVMAMSFQCGSSFILSKHYVGLPLLNGRQARTISKQGVKMTFHPPCSSNVSFAPRPSKVDAVIVGKIIIDEFVLVSFSRQEEGTRLSLTLLPRCSMLRNSSVCSNRLICSPSCAPCHFAGCKAKIRPLAWFHSCLHPAREKHGMCAWLIYKGVCMVLCPLDVLRPCGCKLQRMVGDWTRCIHATRHSYVWNPRSVPTKRRAEHITERCIRFCKRTQRLIKNHHIDGLKRLHFVSWAMWKQTGALATPVAARIFKYFVALVGLTFEKVYWRPSVHALACAFTSKRVEIRERLHIKDTHTHTYTHTS